MFKKKKKPDRVIWPVLYSKVIIKRKDTDIQYMKRISYFHPVLSAIVEHI